jgi:hypothetical protein
MQRFFKLGAVLALAVACGSALGNAEPAIDEPHVFIDSTLPGELDGDLLTLLGIVIGRHGLDDVQRRLGAARVFSPGRATGLLAVCYSAPDPSDETVVMFQALGVDQELRVTSGAITTRANLGTMIRNCGVSRAVSGRVSAGWLAQGLTRTQLRARLPIEPSEDNLSVTGYYFYTPTSANPRGDCQVLSGVRAMLRSGSVRTLTVYRFVDGPACPLQARRRSSGLRPSPASGTSIAQYFVRFM